VCCPSCFGSVPLPLASALHNIPTVESASFSTPTTLKDPSQTPRTQAQCTVSRRSRDAAPPRPPPFVTAYLPNHPPARDGPGVGRGGRPSHNHRNLTQFIYYFKSPVTKQPNAISIVQYVFLVDTLQAHMPPPVARILSTCTLHIHQLLVLTRAYIFIYFSGSY
jgi:hypothetical protein